MILHLLHLLCLLPPLYFFSLLFCKQFINRISRRCVQVNKMISRDIRSQRAGENLNFNILAIVAVFFFRVILASLVFHYISRLWYYFPRSIPFLSCSSCCERKKEEKKDIVNFFYCVTNSRDTKLVNFFQMKNFSTTDILLSMTNS